MAFASSSRAAMATRLPVASCSRVVPARAFSTTTSNLGPKEPIYNPWRGKAHVKPPPSTPPPVVQLFAQRVVATDGSTFTAYTTAPSPQTVVLTRDTLNHPLWNPGTEKRQDEAVEGRVGRFRKMYGGLRQAAPVDESEKGEQGEEGGPEVQTPADFGQADLDWMSEGASEVKAPSGKGPKKKSKRR